MNVRNIDELIRSLADDDTARYHYFRGHKQGENVPGFALIEVRERLRRR